MKPSLWIALAIAVIISIVAMEARSGLGDRVKADDDQITGGWEYLVVQGGTVNLSGDGGSMRKEPGAFSREWFPIERNMDKLGAKGWELVTVTGSAADPVYYFKRRKDR
ncbi:MAG: hypothetical protein WAV20_06030 [Blastocatellia bacterium]